MEFRGVGVYGLGFMVFLRFDKLKSGLHGFVVVQHTVIRFFEGLRIWGCCFHTRDAWQVSFMAT